MTEPRKIGRLVSQFTSETSPQNSSPKPMNNSKPTPIQLGIIGDLGRRFPAPNGVDPETHKSRLRFLAEDCADISPDVLKAACAAAVRESSFLPSAAELRRHAKEAADVPVDEDWGQRRARQFNLDNINSGSPVRAQVKSGNCEFFRPGSPGEKRRCDGQGGVIAPWFSEAKKRSEERSVGKECVSTCRSRCSPNH